MRRRLVALTVVSLMIFGTAACGDQSAKSGEKATASASVDMGQPIPGLSVTGEVGTEPTVKLDTPFNVDKTETEVVKAGDGPAVRSGKDALLHIYLANGATGKKAATTYDQGVPVKVTMSEKQFFPALIKALDGRPSGSRLAVASKVKDIYGESGAAQVGLKADDSVVFVIDVISVDPTEVLKAPEGSKTDVPGTLPTVVEKDGKVTNLDFSKAAAKPATKLQVIPLIEGDGPAVRAPSLVTFNYFGEVYGAKKPFDESYSKEPVTFALGINQLIKGWDQGLVGVKEGSRVMIVAPPEFGYGAAGNPQGGIKGNATLVFVVDILGVG